MNDYVKSFERRFTAVQRRRRVAVGLMAGGALATAVVLIVAVVATLDFRWELENPERRALLLAGLIVVVGLVGWLLLRSLKRWTAGTTASEVEQRHPEFGQRVRTTVQFAQHSGDQLTRAGVEPQLLDALAEETEVNVLPGEMEEVVPTRWTAALVLCSITAAGLLGLSLLKSWEWQTAVLRTLGVDRAFTTMSVEPGDAVVDEGASLAVQFTVAGRPRDEVVVESRPAQRADMEWVAESLGLDAASQVGQREWKYTVQLSRLTEPMTYRVTAGPVTSPDYRVDIRYPLEIQSVNALLSPPAYTGLKPRDLPDGNVSGLKGSQAQITVELDRAPAAAQVVFTRVGKLPQDVERTLAREVHIDGPKVSFDVTLEHDLVWTLQAEAGDGTHLPENAFRIRVQPDHAPKVSFQEPDAELEVHTLAEVLMRIRATDDYGLSRSGIVFQINNGEEHTLLEEDFAAAMEAAEEIDSDDPLSHRTRVTLERLLPLEYFALTEKDSVMYYAFAEDNFPETPQRSESDWRFVDIRPFRMRFRAPDPDDPNSNAAGGRRPLTSLEELIRRERYSLNRTVKLEKGAGRWSEKELGTIDRLIDYQAEIASLTRELAEFLSRFGVTEEVDVLFQAETSMLGAVDTLTTGEFASAVLQEKDAHQYLIEARNRLLVQLGNNAQLRRALMQFNQRMAQKLRRNRMQQNLAQTLLQRLQQLAANQQQTSMQALALAGGQSGTGTGSSESNGNAASAGRPVAAPTDDSEPQQTGDASTPPPVTPDDPSETESAKAMDPAEASPSSGGEIDPEELEERQYAAVEEAKDLLDRLDEVPGLTDLVRERMEAATNLADEAALSFSQGNPQQAGEQTSETAERFGELARQVEALVAREVSDRIAASRGIAGRIAEEERELAEQLENRTTDQSADDSQSSSPMLGRQAERIREGTRTLEDVLKALAGVTDPDAGNAPERITEIIEEQRLMETVARAQTAAESAMAETPPPSTETELEDTAERFELTSNELDRLYRSLVMPRMARLRELERELAESTKGLEQQETRQDVEGYTDDLEELIRDLQEAEAGGASREELFEMVENRNLPGVDDWQRQESDRGANLVAPDALQRLVPLAGEELRRQIHELILADLQTDRESPIPPEYERLVDEYLRVLAADSEQF